MAQNLFDQFDAPASGANIFDQFDEGAKDSGGFASDIGKSLKVGVQELPGMATGLADLPFALATGARPFTKAADVLGEATGFQPGKWAKDTKFSAGYEQGKANIDKAWEGGSAGDIALEYLKNPGYTAQQVVQSVPGMVAGGFGSKLALGAGRIAAPLAKAGGVGPSAPGLLARTVGEKWAVPLAAGAGEGAVTAGQQMAQYQGDDQQKNALAALAAGAGTAAIGVGAGRLANALGLETAETAIAKIGSKAAGAADEIPLSAKQRILGGIVSEAVLQEMPQSAQEQMWQNYADGKPIMEGVARATVEGGLAGGVMGAAANVRGPRAERGPAPEQDAPPGDPTAPPTPMLGNTPDPLISFRDGSVARQSEVDAYLNGLPEEQRAAARAKLMGLAAQPADIGTSLGAADPSAPQREGVAAPQALDATTAPGAAPEGGNGVDFTREFDTSGLNLQDPAEADRARAATVDYAPADTTPNWGTAQGAAPARQGLDMPAQEIDTSGLSLDQRTPSQRMGIDPAAGPNSKAAALAVDSGASDQMQAQALAEQASIATKSGASNKGQANERPSNQPSAGLLPLGGPAGNDAGRGVGTAGAVPRDAGRRDAGASLSSLASNGKLGSAPAGQRGNGNAPLTAPANLRDGLARIRAQRQEAVNAQAAQAPAPAAAPAPVPTGAAAVEAAGVEPAKAPTNRTAYVAEVRRQLGDLQPGDVLENDMGDKWTVDVVMRNKAGEVTGFLPREGNPETGEREVLDLDAAGSVLLPTPYLDASGNRKLSQPGKVNRAQPATPAYQKPNGAPNVPQTAQAQQSIAQPTQAGGAATAGPAAAATAGQSATVGGRGVQAAGVGNSTQTQNTATSGKEAITAELSQLMSARKLLWSDIESAIGRPMNMDNALARVIALKYLKRKASDSQPAATANTAQAAPAPAAQGTQALSWAGMTPDQRKRSTLEREISTGTTNNGGVVASLRPSAIEKRKQALAAMGDAGLAQAAPTTSQDRHPNWRKNAIQAGRVARELGLEPKGKRLAQIVAEVDAKDARGPVPEQSQPATDSAVQTMRGLAQQFRDRHAQTKNDTDRTFAAVLDQFAGEVEQGKRTPESVQSAIDSYTKLAAKPVQTKDGSTAEPATHKDAGESSEIATQSVVGESLKTAAKNEDMKPSDMRKWLIEKIDDAIAKAPEVATEFLYFDVPGDGKFKVSNSKERLQAFRKQVLASPGFKDRQGQPKPASAGGVATGSGTQQSAINNMIEEGDFVAARDYAEVVGLNLDGLKIADKNKQAQWAKFRKDGTIPLPPDALPKPAPKTAAQNDAEKANPVEEPGIDYKGFTRTSTGNGSFDLIDSNLRVRVEPTGRDKYQASVGNTKSSPHLQGEQGAADWADAYRAESIRAQKKDAVEQAPANPAEFTHNGTRIYPVNIKLGDSVEAMWGVESAENKAKREAGERTIGGDSLHETRDAAIKAAEREAKSNAQSEAYRKEREEIAKKEKAAKEAKAADTINGFTEGMAPNTAALAAKALEKEVRFKGEVASIRSFIDKWHEAGTLEVSTTQEPRIKPMSRTAYNRADNKAQDEHERRMKEAGNKTVYWVNDIDLGKIAHDYAQHMLEQEAKPVDGFVESDAAESDYASTAEQVEAAQELLLPIRQGEMITDDVRQTLESLLKIPSLKGFDQPTARRLLMIAGATKAAIEKVMRTNPVSIDDLATELGKATGEAEKKKAFDRAFNAASQIAQTDPKVKELLDIYNVEKSILDGIASERGLYGVKWAERNVSSRWTGQSQKVRSVKQRLVDAVNKAAPSGVRQGLAGARAKKAAEPATPTPESKPDASPIKTRAIEVAKREYEKEKNRNLKELRATESAYDILLEDTAEKIDAMAARANGESIADIKKRGEEFGSKTGGSFSLEDYTVALFKKESDAKAALKLLDGVYAEAEQIAADIAKAPTNAQEGIAAAQANAARFEIGKSLTKEQRKQVLESLVDTYKTKGAEREFKGQDSNGNDRYGYVYSPELFEKSDITGAMVRYYVTLPDGRIAHPTELFPDVSASDVERMALEQESKRRRIEAFDNAIKPFYSDFDSANLMAVTGQVVISKGDRFAVIPDRIGSVNRARQQGWEPAKAAAPAATIEDAGETKQTDKGVAMFSRTGAQSSNAQQPTTRAWYDRFVSLLPASYRNDPHRREPLPTEDWNVQRASEVRSKVEALNKQLRGADDRKGYGPVSVDGLGNLQVDARDVSAADLTGGIMALANELGAGIAVTNVRSADARALQNSGFVPESSLAAIADRLMQRPFASPTNNYAKDSAPGAIMTYKPRGFPAALFARDVAQNNATPALSRADSNAQNVATQMMVDGLTEKWTRVPEIIVARNMQDPQIPQEVRDYDAELKSQGSDGEARGFIYKGKVYLLSDQLKGPEQIAEVLFHEVLGHYGLRGVFGEGLDPILMQLGTMRRKDVVTKAREYGLFDKDALGGLDKKTASVAQIWAAMSAKDRLSAAEEVLAEMAQTQPTIGFVKRAIALIRNWLRANVPGFDKLALTDADIIQAYILPARGFVTRSQETPKQSIERAMLAFSRVWHGSPHKFLQFDSSKIGTGEGAQAYGHGLYLAESPDVAKSYQTTLTMDRGFNFGGKSGLTRDQLQDLVSAREGGKYLDGVTKPSGVADQVIDSIVYGKNGELPRSYKTGSERAALFEKLKQEITHTDQGALYQVDLPDDQIAKMLDWDKPLSEQTEQVKQALRDAAESGKLKGGYITGAMGERKYQPALSWGKSGESLLRSLERVVGFGGNAEALLKDIGIPGIRYLDGGSRGNGAGTSNYVIFPGMEKILTIIDVNGEPVTGAEKAKVLGEQMDMAFSRAPQSRSAAIKEMLDAQAAWDKMKKGDAENITLEKFSEMTDRSINARTALADELVSMPDDGFALQAKTSDGRMLILTPSAQKAGKWQLTRFGSDGTPWGDTNFDTKKQAALEFIDEADLKTIQGADNEGAAFSRGTNEAMTNKDVVGNTQGGRSADDTTKGTDDATGLPLNADGTVTVYHHTSKSNADAIRKNGTLKAQAEPDVYVTTRRETDTGYGDTAVPIRVRPDQLIIDDEFPDGRKDFRLNVGKPGGSINVNVANESTAPDSGGAAFSRTAGDQTQTEAFKRWFAGSKAVDADGQPLVVYHGTGRDFAAFDEAAQSSHIPLPGFYFSPDPDIASSFAESAAKLDENRAGRPFAPIGANVIASYLSLQNPAEIDASNGAHGGRMPSERVIKDLLQKARKQGHDGAVIRGWSDGSGPVQYVAFRPEQVKSAIGNSGAFDPANPDIRFSRTSPIESSMGALNAQQEAAYRNVAGVKRIPTIKERADAFKANLGLRMKQALVDQFAPIKDVSQEAYMLSRMSKGSDGAIDATLLYGKPFLRDGVLDVNIQDGGFAKVLASLKGEHDRFFMWVAAQRGERLKDEGKENLMGDADISALKTLNQGQMVDGTARIPLYANALRELNDFNEASLKVALQSGLIDQTTYDTMKDQPYVPFYRLMEDEGAMTGPRFSSGLLNQQAWKKLKGGTQQLNADLMENTLLNWSHLYAASARNRAALSTMDAAEAMGVAYKVNAYVKGSVKVMRDGMTEHWMVEDPYLLEAVSALNYSASPLMKPLATMKKLLTWGVTVNPTFKIRNLIRDSVSAIAQSDLGFNPAGNVLQGWKLTAKDSQVYASMLASGGVIKFGTQENSERLRRQVADLGGVMLDKNGLDKLKGQLKTMYEAYQEIGDRTENVNRAALYDQLIKNGKSHAEASFMARDLMDFSMGGSHPAVRFLTQTAPFLNARLQGLYKLGRAAQEDPKKFAAVTGAVALASLALMAAYSDDDDWKKREDWDRDAYWWFKIGDTAYRIPKPFEVGAIGTLAERTAELMFNKEMTNKRFMERIGFMAGQTFSFDPVPQAVKPLLDVYANKDSFTQRPIESQADQRLRPQDRYNERTSEVARLLGSWGLPDPGQLIKGDYAGLSPKQIDHLLRGYFSWVATASTTASDFLIRPALDRGTRPEMRLRDTFLAGNFVEGLPTGSSRYVTQLYEQSKAVEQAYASYRDAIKSGDMEKARSIQDSDGPKLRNHMAYAHATKQLSEINAQAKRIESNKIMSGEVKRERLTELELRRDQVARRVAALT